MLAPNRRRGRSARRSPACSRRRNTRQGERGVDRQTHGRPSLIRSLRAMPPSVMLRRRARIREGRRLGASPIVAGIGRDQTGDRLAPAGDHYLFEGLDAVEYQIRDRLSFMRFVGLALHEAVPDATTTGMDRKQLTKARALKHVSIGLTRCCASAAIWPWAGRP